VGSADDAVRDLEGARRPALVTTPLQRSG